MLLSFFNAFFKAYGETHLLLSEPSRISASVAIFTTPAVTVEAGGFAKDASPKSITPGSTEVIKMSKAIQILLNRTF